MAKAKKSRWAMLGILLVIAVAGYFFIDQS